MEMCALGVAVFIHCFLYPLPPCQVIVGGTRTENDWLVSSPKSISPRTCSPDKPRYPSIRPETTLDILQRGLALCPQLAPEHIRNARTPTVEDLLPLVIDEGCGLRPARKGGIRLDVVPFEMPGSDRIVPVVYNYG
jgi:D-amino-acid oxidase